MSKHTRALRSLACWAAALGTLLPSAAGAKPYAPERDDTIVETLRDKPLDAQDRAYRALKARVRAANAQAAAPGRSAAMPVASLGPALQLARAAIDRARREGDPREIGVAQGALLPWWQHADPPPAVRLLRATIMQSMHAFTAARADLDALLEPRTRWPVAPAIGAQARFTRAAILQTQGQYAAAATDCRALQTLVPLESAACLAELQGLQGHAAAARRTLGDLASRQAFLPAGATHAWLALMRAELAERMGLWQEAQALYQQALAAQADAYTLGAYADYLLDRGRAREVLALLQGRERIDALLLRQALAWQQLGDAEHTRQATAELQARFDAAALRGDRVHLREHARYALQLARQPALALKLAQENWQVQREPADARLLLQAARAAGDTTGARALQRSLQQQAGYVDARWALDADPTATAARKPARSST